MLEKIKAVFSEKFAGETVIFRSPGRINILFEQIGTACQKEMNLVLSVCLVSIENETAKCSSNKNFHFYLNYK